VLKKTGEKTGEKQDERDMRLLFLIDLERQISTSRKLDGGNDQRLTKKMEKETRLKMEMEAEIERICGSLMYFSGRSPATS
jgi:hypothetical protein